VVVRAEILHPSEAGACRRIEAVKELMLTEEHGKIG
jgi:hypothetical protein